MPFFFPDNLSVSMLLSNNSPDNTKPSGVSPHFPLYIFHMLTFVFGCSSGKKLFTQQSVPTTTCIEEAKVISMVILIFSFFQTS